MRTIHQTIHLADILRSGIDAYVKKYGPLPKHYWKVINHLTNCHTPAAGSSLYKCDNCSTLSLHYNSCRDRHCPSCQSIARAQWVQKRMDELLPVGYFHVVFTIPAELNPLVLRNKERMYSLLFKAVSKTLLTLGQDKKWHGGTIGFLTILHTWGQNLMDHPHIHCIIPGGGIRADGKKWKAFRDNYIFPVKVMNSLFKRIFIELLEGQFSSGNIAFYSEKPSQLQTNETFSIFIKDLKKKQWCVYAKKPFATPEHVIKYLGSYTHRIAISNRRIVKFDGEHVWFKWKDYTQENKQKIMKLDVVEFIRRILLHILPSRFVRIRYYGFLSNNNRVENINKCLELLKQKRKFTATPYLSVADFMLRVFGVNVSNCTHCKEGTMSVIYRTRNYNTHRGKRYRKATLRPEYRPGLRSFNKRQAASLDRKGRLRPFGQMPAG